MRPHRFWTDRLSEALDGTLSPEQMAVLEEHLAGCPACRRVQSELGEVRRRARALTASPPAEDLWGGIAAAIGATEAGRREDDKVIPMHTDRPPAPSLQGSPSGRLAVAPVHAAAAAVLLLALGGVMGAAMADRSTAGEPSVAAAAPEAEAQIRLAAGEVVEPSLFAELRTLEEALRMDLARLDPETRTAILGNLETIDRAIRESVGALQSDPESRYLKGHLGSALQRKVGYLQSVTRLLES